MEKKLTSVFFHAENLPKYLFHYTNWGTLKDFILKFNEKRISLIAKRIDEYWKLEKESENQSPDSEDNEPKNDPYEFRGMLYQLDLLSKSKRIDDKQTLFSRLKEISDNNIDIVHEIKDAAVFGSTLTPYFFCFAGTCSEEISKQISNWSDKDMKNITKGNSSELSHEICNDEPVILAFETSRLINLFGNQNDYSKIFGDQASSIKRVELFKIGYYSSENTEDALLKNSEKVKELAENFDKQKIHTFDLGDVRENNPTKQDWAFDACIYNKDARFALEDEYRLIFREAADFIFWDDKKGVDGKGIKGKFASPLETIPRSNGENADVPIDVAVCKFGFLMNDNSNPLEYIAFPRDKQGTIAKVAERALCMMKSGVCYLPQIVYFNKMKDLSNN